jgi:hypothetical protein
MNYEVIALACQKLNYRDKLRLAQLLIQAARKEEENANPQSRTDSQPIEHSSKTEEKIPKEIDTIKYAIERLRKLKPTKKSSLINSIKSMFQFQGGISDTEINKIIVELQKRKYIKLEQNNVTYL